MIVAVALGMLSPTALAEEEERSRRTCSTCGAEVATPCGPAVRECSELADREHTVAIGDSETVDVWNLPMPTQDEMDRAAALFADTD